MTTLIKHNAGKFFLMENCPEPPTWENFTQKASPHTEFEKANEAYEQALQSIPAIEISNPELLPISEVFPNSFAFLGDQYKPLNDGDFFPLPETVGYEIGYQYYCFGWSDCSEKEYNMHLSEKHDVQKVARLYVKAEKGETQEEISKNDYNKAIDDVLFTFQPLFTIEPTSSNIVQIAESMKSIYENIQKLRKA